MNYFDETTKRNFSLQHAHKHPLALLVVKIKIIFKLKIDEPPRAKSRNFRVFHNKYLKKIRMTEK